MDDLRRPALIIALVCFVIATGIETGAGWANGAVSESVKQQQWVEGQLLEQGVTAVELASVGDVTPGNPAGLALPHLTLLELLLLMPLVWMALSLVLSHAVLGRVQAIVTLFVSLGVLIIAFIWTLKSLGELFLMLGLFLAVPFGTVIYFARYAAFPVAATSALLAASLTFKIAGGVLLIVAQQRFLKVKGLVFLFLTSLLCNVIIAFLHGFPPVFLASILDAVAAIIIGILTILWAVPTLIGGIVGSVRAVRSLS